MFRSASDIPLAADSLSQISNRYCMPDSFRLRVRGSARQRALLHCATSFPSRTGGRGIDSASRCVRPIRAAPSPTVLRRRSARGHPLDPGLEVPARHAVRRRLRIHAEGERREIAAGVLRSFGGFHHASVRTEEATPPRARSGRLDPGAPAARGRAAGHRGLRGRWPRSRRRGPARSARLVRLARPRPPRRSASPRAALPTAEEAAPSSPRSSGRSPRPSRHTETTGGTEASRFTRRPGSRRGEGRRE